MSLDQALQKVPRTRLATLPTILCPAGCYRIGASLML